jgi:hypothetical protein
MIGKYIKGIKETFLQFKKKMKNSFSREEKLNKI